MQNPVVNTKGEPAGKIDLPDAIFAAKGNPKLLAQAVRVYLSNQRHAKARAKTRGEVSGSGKKIWRQKGTGRARHGDRYAPLFVGGGVAHGPTGKENFKLKLPKKLRRQTLFTALTQKLEAKSLVVVDGLEEVEPKTSKISKILKKVVGDVNRISIIVPEGNHSIIRGARNLKGMHLLFVKSLNTYDILNAGTLVVAKSVLPEMKETFLEKGEAQKQRTPKPGASRMPQRPNLRRPAPTRGEQAADRGILRRRMAKKSPTTKTEREIKKPKRIQS